MSTNQAPVNTDPFGLWMMKPTKAGGQVWYIYNTDFNDDPQVYTESISNEYLVHNIEDADGTRFTISASDTFKAYISTSTGYQPSQVITDQQQMLTRGYMQNPQDWRNVEVTAQMVVFKEADDFITFGFRGGKHTGNGAPAGCTASTYLVEINMKAGGLIRVRKKSWNTSIHNWLSGLASGFNSTKVCGWTIKILCYNTQDGNNVNVEVWLAPDNDNRFTKVLSGVDTGQLNTDANVCNCTNTGQPLTWGGPMILLQGNTGTFGFKNLSIREIEGYGATLPPVDPGSGSGGTGGGTGGTGGGGGSGSGTGGGGTGGGGGVPVDLTPVLATPKTNYTKYGGGPQYNPLEFYVIFAGAAWNTAPVTTTAGSTVTTYTDPNLAPRKSSDMSYHDGMIFTEATVHFIFWGSQWNTKTTPWSKTSIMNAMQKVFQSSYFEGLLQYGFPNGDGGPSLCRKPKIGSIAINTTYATRNNFDSLDLLNVIIDSINHNQVPDMPMPDAYDPNNPPTFNHHIYYIIGSHNNFPATSFVDAASFHYLETYPADNSIYIYAYTNDMDFVNGNSTDMLYMTYGMTHEIVEAITDPMLQGWYASSPNPTSGDVGEIADLCDTEYNINGVICSGYFSNEDNACIAPTVKPSWISCPTGSTWDPVTQKCAKTSTTPAPTPIPVPTPQPGDPIFKTPKTTNMAYGGGPNMSIQPMEIYVIFTGAAWNTNTTYKNQMAQLKTQIQAVFDSHYFEGLFQYHANGKGIPKPKLMPFLLLTTYEFPNGYGENEDVVPAFNALSSSGFTGLNSTTTQNRAHIWIPTPDKSYTISAASGTHSAFADTDFEGGTDPNLYWYIFALINTAHPFSEWIPTICHEVVELLSDNYPFKGYTNKAGSTISGTSQYEEIADVCQAGASGFITPPGNSFQVAKYWSDYDGACISPYANAPSVPVTCPTGYTWNPVTQTCDKNTSTGGGGGGGTGGTPTPPPPTPNIYNTANSTLKTKIQNDITTIFNSNYFLPLYQYGATKKPNLKGFVVATNPPANLIRKGHTQDNNNAFLADCVAKNLVPVNKQSGPKNIAYMVIMPPHMESDDGSEGTHGAHELNPSSITDPNQKWYYLKSFVTLVTTYEDFTDTITHELAESVASQIASIDSGYVIKAGTPLDPQVAKYNNEIADVCMDQPQETLNGVTMAKYWSDQDGKCILPSSSSNPTPWLTCHTGAVFDNTTQACKLQPSSGGGGTTPPGGGGTGTGGTGSGSGQGYKVALANASDDDGHVPANAIDGKLDTRWSAFGKGQFLRLDLGTAKKVDKIKIAWYQGDKRTNNFEITTAETTGGAYTSQFTGTSKKGSAALQDYPIHPANPVRYVRIIVNGNSDNDWASISEAEVWGPDVPSTTPGTGTGGDPGSGGVTPGGDTGGGTQTPPADGNTEVPEFVTAYNFFDTSFSCDFHKIGLCNPAE